MAEFYHGLTKKVIGAFGSIFSDIHITRRKGDTVKGEKIQQLHIPISYAPKEKWIQALESNPTRQKEVSATFPRLSFETTGFSYDGTRKITRSNEIKFVDESGLQKVYAPAPWNLDISLYIVSKNLEDVYQIMEQILPKFNPDRSLKLKILPFESNTTVEVPISLDSISIEDSYDGDYTSHRYVVYTLTFTVKMSYYGEFKSPSSIIYNVETNVGNKSYRVSVEEDGKVIHEGWMELDGDYTILSDVHPHKTDLGGPKVVVAEKPITHV